MGIPFSIEQFFSVFAQYNESVWPMQVILNLLALVAIILLYRARPLKSRVLAAVLSFLWGWMAIAYHFAFFTTINSAAWLFGAVFMAGTFWFGWTGVMRSKLHFCLGGGIRGWAGGFLIGFALIVYHLLGYAMGHHYPAVPTFGLIFTIGVLHFVAAPVPRSVFAVPLVWAAVGSIAAFQLGVLQDLGLLVAGLVGVVAVIFVPALQ
ncbi:MAG: hypothetical protein DMG49_27590 [Acidobacteria bacterium]|nr:MAG: hypothetical protein DMG49_27590 [Acidobacteriota bacterium]